MPLPPTIETWLSRCERALVAVAVLATAGMTLLTTSDAASRYFLNQPINGAYEVTEKYLMAAAIFLGLSYAYRGGALIRVTFLVERLRGRGRWLADAFAHLVSLAFCAVVLVATAQQSIQSLADATTLNTLPVPLGPAHCLVPLGFLALTLVMIVDLARASRSGSLLFTPPAPEA